MKTLKTMQLLALGGLVAVMAGCASVPHASDAKVKAVLQQPIEKVQQASVSALTVTGFDLQKQESTYVEGFRPRKMGLFVGSGGETVGVWLAALSPAQTEVKVKTSKSIAGMAGQKNWDNEVMAEITRMLGK